MMQLQSYDHRTYKHHPRFLAIRRLLGQRHWHLIGQLLLTLGLLVGLGVTCLPSLWAQAVVTPFLEITGVAVDHFPELSVTVYGEGIDGSLSGATIAMVEDGVPQEITKSETVLLGTQTLLALDSSATLLETANGKSALDQVVSGLVERQFLTAGRDWLSFITFEHSEAGAAPQVVSAWQSEDYQSVVTDFSAYQPAAPQKVTPLYDLLRTAILHFDENSAAPPNLTRSIVLFTDGLNPLTTAAKEELFSLALDHRVRIHTVQVGDDPGGEQQLRSLAQSTNGRYQRLALDTPQLNELWQVIQGAQVQRMLTYRTTRPSPQQVTVSATAGERPLDDAISIPAVTVAPPQVSVVTPAFDALERMLSGGQRPQFDTPLTDLTPKTLDVAVVVNWPDGHPRRLSRVEYSLNNQPVIRDTEPYTTVTLPLETLDKGEYTIRVRATDELGLIGDYAIKPLSITIDRLEPPKPPEVAIVKPEFTQLERTLPNVRFNTPLTDLEPKALEVGIELVWPDNQPRALRQVEYTLGDQTVVRATEPFTEVTIPIAALDAGDYTLHVKVLDERDLSGEATQPLTLVMNLPAPPPPPAITILQPEGSQLLRRLPAGSQDEALSLAELEPQTLEVAVELTWPDGQSRQLKRVEYTLGNESVVRTEEPFTTAILPIAALDQGDQRLQVRAVDADDIVGEVQQSLQIMVDRTLPPTPKPWGFLIFLLLVVAGIFYLWYDPAARQRANGYWQQGQSFLNDRAPVVNESIAKVTPVIRQQADNIAAVVGAQVANLRQRRGNPGGTEIWNGSGGAATQVEEAKVVAQLIYLENGDPPQANIALPASGARLGRDPSLAHKVITDRRVSRLHCRIVQEANGAFRLWDEGSAGGTYVQGKRVEMSGQLLQPGDVIGVGPVRYRFEIVSEPSPQAADHYDPGAEATLVGNTPYGQDDGVQDDGAQEDGEPHNADDDWSDAAALDAHNQ
ncbi:MAG: FHA domain-containing protein [Caldilineaceae bacterium]